MTSAFDVCVIGAGAVGLYLADRLAARGLKVLLVEAGETPGAADATLLGPVSTVTGYQGAARGWSSGPGGTTRLWGGQLWPWTAAEFDDWPIPNSEVTSRYRRVLETLGLPSLHSDIHNGLVAQQRLTPAGLQDGVGFRYSTWIPSAERDFWRNRALAGRRGGYSVQLGAQVTGLDEGSNGVAVRGVDRFGEPHRWDARRVVVAAGTLGTTKLLSSMYPGLPVGTGLMDHPSARRARAWVRDWERFRRFAAPKRVGGVLASPRLVLDGSTRAYGHWEVCLNPDGLGNRVRAVLRHEDGVASLLKSAAIRSAARGSGALLSAGVSGALHRERPMPSDAQVFLRIDAAQPVTSANRIVWENPAGERRLSLRWSVDRHVRDELSTAAERIAERIDFAEAGLAGLELDDSDEPVDTFHMMGGTCMSRDAFNGVVDVDGLVHGATAVYVGGASAFPTSGMANPTYTALALADRLAEHLGG